MINRPHDWEETKPAMIGGEREKLPAGGYEARIMNVKIVDNSNGTQRLDIMLDITAGEYKDFFKRDFDNNPFDNKKWRGVARFFLPVDDGSKGDNFKKRLLKAMVEALEQSNRNYKWDWNEKRLKGLFVGILVRDKEYDIEGNKGFCTEIFEFVPIDIIKKGEFSTPAPKYLNGKSPSVPTQDEAPMPSDADAPPENADDDYPF